MRKLRSLLFLALLASAAIFKATADVEASVEDDVVEEEEDDEYADVERAHLIVRKYVQQDMIVQGRNLTVYLEIYNSGSYVATNVNMQDSIPESLELIEGSLQANIPRISVGESYKTSYVVIPSQADSKLILGPADVSYIAEPDSSERQLGVSTIPFLAVLSPVQQIQRWALVAGKVVTLGMAKNPTDWRNLSFVLGGFGVLFAVNWSVKSVSASRDTRKRQRALEDLSKE